MNALLFWVRFTLCHSGVDSVASIEFSAIKSPAIKSSVPYIITLYAHVLFCSIALCPLLSMH